MYCLVIALNVATVMQPPSEMINRKLDAVSGKLIANGGQLDFINQEFNLDHPEVSKYMVAKMNTLPGRGEGASPKEILDQLMIVCADKTMEWILDHYDQLTPIGLRHVAYSMIRVDNRECYQLLSKLLCDRRVVVNERAARISPSPYYHDRVCDCAYSTIVFKLYMQKKLPQGFPHCMVNSLPYEQRDRIFKRFLEWWSGESDVIIQSASPLSIRRPSLRYKMEAVMQKSIPPGDR